MHHAPRASLALAAVLAAALSAAGCKTTNTVTSTQRITTDPILDLDASAAQVRTSRVAGDLLQAQVDLYNTWITEQNVKYKWEWIDAAGNVVLSAVGGSTSPFYLATSGTFDPTTGVLTLTYDKQPFAPPKIGFDYAYTTQALGAGTKGLAQPLARDAVKAGDHYSLNPKDAGMRVVLPGDGQPVGTPIQYFIRVRSQPRYEPVTTVAPNGSVTAQTKAAYEADLADPAKVKSGATSGAYELRVRLRQLDEKPGSTVRYADIRYPTIGIDVQGLPRNTPLVGETAENAGGSNETFATAQYVGNLLQTDRNTISIAGNISDSGDIDWYTFALNYEQIQSIGGVNGGKKTWATVFDLDYGDGIRGDLTISVFDSSGRLLYIGRDSNVAADQPGAGQEIGRAHV